MRTTMAGLAERRPLRSRLGDPAGSFRRGELAAALATAAIAGQLLFAQVTLLAAVALVAVGRLSRWRPHWLAGPALASLIWLLTVGVAGAAAGLDEGARRLSAFLLEAAVHPGRLAHPAAALAGAGAWLPRQLPLALLAACGEAWLLLWLGWWRPGLDWRWRPGLVTMTRRELSARALAAGRTVTADGCAVGLVAGTGKLAGVSWAEAVHGVLLMGRDVDQLGLAITCAALRRRKTVLIFEHAGQVCVSERIRELARSVGVPVTEARGGAASGAGVSGAIGRAIRSRETVLMATSHAEAARQATGDLARVLGGLRDLGLRADCLAWISGGEVTDSASMSELLALGRVTGTAIVLTAASLQHAATLAHAVGVVVVSGPVDADLAQDLTAVMRRSAGSSRLATAEVLACQPDGEFTVLAGMRSVSGPARADTHCCVVPITPEHLR
jgi:hypothetical protein